MIKCDMCNNSIKISDFNDYNGRFKAYSYLDTEKNEKHVCRDCVALNFTVIEKRDKKENVLNEGLI